MPLDSDAHIRFVDQAPALESFEDSVLAGLHSHPKQLSAKFFYDERGSALFEKICERPEYYPTRTELGILTEHAAELAQRIGPGALLIEFGAGALEKVRILLAALDSPAGFAAIDISGDHLKEAAETLAQDFPEVDITAICADYCAPLDLAEPLASSTARRVGFFPGSTIGNFTPLAAAAFLRVVKPIFEPRGLFIVGVDLRKDSAILNAAYNDAAGVTAAFNLNILAHINRELGANFDLSRFRHKAFYNEAEGRVEMHLESCAAQTVTIGGTRFDFAKGETIHTENSYKYTVADFQALARSAGWAPVDVICDDDRLFSVHILKTGWHRS